MYEQTIIGLDIGRSAVKAVAFANGQEAQVTFPSLVCHAIQLTDENSIRAAEPETVIVEGRKYFTGDTARLQGGATSSIGLSNDWTETPEYQALVLSAIKRLSRIGVPGLDTAYIVVGTPAALYGQQRDRLEELTRKAAPNADVKALSQPMGAFLSFFLNQKGLPVSEHLTDEVGRRKSWAVIEVGHFTTDFLLMKEGVHIDRKSDSCEGIFMAAEQLGRILSAKGIDASPVACEEALRTKKIRHFGVRDIAAEVAEAAEFVVAKIMTKTNALLAAEAATVDGVLLAGGGAPIIHESLLKQWPHVMLLPEPRMAVAEGFCRFGKGQLRKRAAAITAKHMEAVNA
ncbi:ParM/StbA family protein [Noviherbaspirillum pedocola]|uniref:ParM/StbA family protein n=1 Tax=Noviherbaspirillum pedocola TaxID=2801341 RepID=A0A934SY87_9BURK|nr:ParM/StbA family protein [Noviherbaspirillum pedocola]MBK4737947.1 ParM/StbA family protein [Noviherbaspirillum pedocola]